MSPAEREFLLAVSWRSIAGPRAAVPLNEFGEASYALSIRLCMRVVNGVAYLGPRTPDLAEQLLAEEPVHLEAS